MTDIGSSHLSAIRFAGPGKLAAHHATILFDPDSGEIAQIHQILVVEGGANPGEDERAKAAKNLARRRGHDPESLELLHVDGSAIRRGFHHSVDVATRSLVYKEAPPPRRNQ